MQTTVVALPKMLFQLPVVRLPLAAFFALFISACTVVPGSHMSHRAERDKDDDSPALPDIVNVRPLTTALLSSSTDATGKTEDDAATDAPADTAYQYRVGPGDVLQVTVWDHPELTIPAGSLRSAEESGNWVHADGSIFYPYVGRIEVAGLDVTQIRDLITRRISKYIENPQVDVTVAAFRSQRVYVTGEVLKPGAVPVTNVPMYLIDAVNAAGGILETADWRQVTLTRGDQEQHFSLRDIYQEGRMKQNVLLQDKDVVHVASNLDNKVFVLGEVKQAKTVFMSRNGLSLAQALSDAGGINEMTSNASGIFVMRQGAEEEGEPRIDVFKLKAKDAAAFVLADQFALQPRDVVYVTAAPVARWNRVIQQLLPTAQLIYFGARAEDEITN